MKRIKSMKKIIFILLPLINLLVSVSSTKAAVNLSQFAIQSQYLNGQGKFNPIAGAATPFTASFTLIKNGTQYNSVVVTLIVRELSGTETTLSTQLSRLDGDWTIANSNIWQSNISGTLPAGKTGTIYLKYVMWEGSSQGATSYSSGVAINDGTTTQPVPSPGIFPVNDPRYVKPARTYSGGTTIAVNGIYHLEFQGDGNLVLYKNAWDVLWAADVIAPGGTLEFRTDGLVRIFNSNGTLAKSLNPKVGEQMAYPNCWWNLQADGNFVGYQSYKVLANGDVDIVGKAIGSTDTQGGKRSNRYGIL